MRSMQKVTRLLQLYDSLLKMREWEQKQSAEEWGAAEQELSAIVASKQEAETNSQAQSLTGHEAMLWNMYLGYLDDKERDQLMVVEDKKNRYEERREQTVLAYQEKEKWNLQKTRMETVLARETFTRNVKSADDLAIQRYVGHQRNLFDEVKKTGEISGR